VGITAPTTEYTEDSWDDVINVNLKGVWRCCRYAIPKMLESGAGSIVTLSSVTALCPPTEFFRSHAYMTSKGGVITAADNVPLCRLPDRLS